MLRQMADLDEAGVAKFTHRHSQLINGLLIKRVPFPVRVSLLNVCGHVVTTFKMAATDAASCGGMRRMRSGKVNF
jgi:hypothetical protein